MMRNVAVLAIAAAIMVAAAATASATPKHEAVVMMGNCGPIVMELLPQDAPKTVAFFTKLAREGWYTADANQTRWCYRYVPGFVLQYGGYNVSESGVPVEYKLPNEKFTVSMARSSEPLSGGSEFFINLQNNTKALAPGGSSKHGYTVFGKVVGGFSAIDCLQKLPHHFDQKMGMNTFYQPWPVIKDIRIM